MEHSEGAGSVEPGINIRDYLHLMWSWAWLIVLAGALAGAAAYFVSMRMTPIYEGSTTLLVSSPSSINGVDPAALVTTQTMTSTYAAMLVDRPVLQGVIDQLNLVTTPEDLKKQITVDPVLNTQLLMIAVQDPDAQRAADIANTLASVFSTRIRQLQSDRYSASREGLAKQVSDMEQQIASTSSQIAVIQQQFAVATQAAEATATQAASASATSAAAGNDASAPAPTMATAEPVDTTELDQLQARLTQYRTIYAGLVTSFEQVRLAQDQTSTNVVVSEPASANPIPVKPRTLLNTALASVAGVLLAVGGVLGIEALDDTIKGPDQVRRTFGLPILGMITSHESAEQMPIALAEPRSPTAEAFRSLRTNIMFGAVDRPLRRIMITSAVPQEGKTTVAANLAVVMSQNEKRVLLIDADMRRPELHRKFGLANRLGLSQVFLDSPERATNPIQASGVSGLSVMTSGGLPPNPSELLTSKVMGQVLDKLGQAFDILIVDVPPLLPVSDAAALAPAMDGVVVIAKPGFTRAGLLRQALEQLRAVNAPVLGLVLNEVNLGSPRYGHYYGRYYERDSVYFDNKRTHAENTKPRGAHKTPAQKAETAQGVESKTPAPANGTKAKNA